MSKEDSLKQFGRLEPYIKRIEGLEAQLIKAREGLEGIRNKAGIYRKASEGLIINATSDLGELESRAIQALKDMEVEDGEGSKVVM